MTLDEKVFRKMGYTSEDWKEDDGSGHGRNDTIYGLMSSSGDKKFEFDELPPISSQWEVCAKYLVPFMKERDWRYEVCEYDGGLSFWWFDEINGYGHKASPVKGHNHAEAACKAFIEVELK